MADLSYAELSCLLKADFETGQLYWLERPASMFSSERAANSWNSRFSGKEAFSEDANGYLKGKIHGRMYRAHRVIWALAYGAWPTAEIDHINGITSDNRLMNLRCVSHSDNLKNQRMKSTNTTGAMGVYWFSRDSKWIAQIAVGNRQKHIGVFESYADAVSARKAAEATHGYHSNHGRA